MHDKADLANGYRRRAEEVRRIAQGIFDQEERQTLMQVADDYENWALVVEGDVAARTVVPFRAD
jgi:hypothetical protein